MYKNHFAKLCKNENALGLKVCDCDKSKYPNITFITNGVEFNFTPEMYIMTVLRKDCALGIQNSG